MFGGAVFLGQYFQIGRGYTPTEAGLLTIPMMAGVLVSSTVAGRLITRTGQDQAVHRRRHDRPGRRVRRARHHRPRHAAGVRRRGACSSSASGVGMTMQNLVLAVQNTVALRDIGAASCAVAFFRSLGGTIGVSVLGAVLAHQVADQITDGLAAAGVPAGSGGGRVQQPQPRRPARAGPADRARRVRGRDRAHLPDLRRHRGGRVSSPRCSSARWSSARPSTSPRPLRVRNPPSPAPDRERTGPER